ncbi:hypothetical protein D9U65_14305 [Vibrio cholerae]|nr:hypothetical protein [Vibrio cholerae]
MVTVVAFEFSVMRCQPLRRALCAMSFIVIGVPKSVSSVSVIFWLGRLKRKPLIWSFLCE